MSPSMKGLSAGLVATLAVSLLVIFKTSLNIVPELSLIQLLTRIGNLSVVQAWMDHFIIGVVVWGLLFAAVESMVEKGTYLVKGLGFGVFAWLVMMIVFMPVVNAGFFGAKIGVMAAVVTLFYHLVYGAVLGVTYGFLTIWAPIKDPKASPQA
jgi:hypothetical protein